MYGAASRFAASGGQCIQHQTGRVASKWFVGVLEYGSSGTSYLISVSTLTSRFVTHDACIQNPERLPVGKKSNSSVCTNEDYKLVHTLRVGVT